MKSTKKKTLEEAGFRVGTVQDFLRLSDKEMAPIGARVKSKTKTFDCVEMKREGSRHIYKQIKDMTPRQGLAYWKERSARLDRKIKSIKRKNGKAA